MSRQVRLQAPKEMRKSGQVRVGMVAYQLDAHGYVEVDESEVKALRDAGLVVAPKTIAPAAKRGRAKSARASEAHDEGTTAAAEKGPQTE